LAATVVEAATQPPFCVMRNANDESFVPMVPGDCNATPHVISFDQLLGSALELVSVKSALMSRIRFGMVQICGKVF
jgi:hypothetical protein